MRLSRLVIVAVLIVAAPAAARAQYPPMTASDSALLHVTSIRILFDRLASGITAEHPIWLRLHVQRPDTGSGSPLQPSETQWREISHALPSARLAGARDTLFECPPGVRVSMPGTGCPIRENGIIVEVDRPVVDGDSATMWVWLIESGASDGRTLTWAQGLALVLERAGDGRTWRLRAVRARFIT